MKRNLVTIRAVTFVAVLLLAAACGGYSKPAGHADAPPGTSDAPPGAHACVFDTDTFDNGCTFGP